MILRNRDYKYILILFRNPLNYKGVFQITEFSKQCVS